MTIFIQNQDETTESIAASDMAAVIQAHMKGIGDEKHDRLKVLLIPSVQCYGEATQDIDLVLIIYDRRNKGLFHATNLSDKKTPRNIRSLCLTIEIKDHPLESTRFEGNKCFVQYHGHDHNVTTQNESQKYSLRNFIQRNIKSRDVPWVTNLIWLRNVPKEELPKRVTHNVLGSNSNWQDIINLIDANVPERSNAKEIISFQNDETLYQLKNMLTEKIQPTAMDRRKIEAISKKLLKQGRAQWEEKLGEQLLVFRGRGGTGKTVRLLRLADYLYEHSGSRVLILTYNNALVADLSRLVTLMGLQGKTGERAIQIKTVHSFIGSWLSALGLLKKEVQFLKHYRYLKSEVVELIKGDALKADDIHQAIQKNSDNLAWDYIMIDESQDWPKDERDILYSLYDHKIFVIADGVDQMVRGQEQADWRYQLDKSETQIISLRKSLRLKENICRFVKDFSEEIEYDWDVEPEPESWGGRVIIAVGNDYLKKSFHEELFSQVRKDKNALIDMLFCVPPSWVKHNAEKRRKTSRPGDGFEKWGYQTWDAVDEQDSTRKNFPTELNQLRIVQYDSCRGLEGWTVVTYGLDTFFEYKQQSFVDLAGQDELFVDEEDRRLLFAKRWLMIPLTRAIDTLVLHIESEDSYVGKVLSAMRGKENVVWM